MDNTTFENTIDRASKPRLHLAYLDGFRGLCALYVVLVHAHMELPPLDAVAWSHQFPIGWALFSTLLSYGHYAVIAFIVLSGYCLAMPIVHSSDRWFKGGIVRYIKRRALRILPPYYGALVFSGLIILAMMMLVPDAATAAAANFDLGVILSHLLLIHNLNGDWIHKINSPMWSVATEWQIYFALPVLIALWRRFGLIAMSLSGIAAGIAIRLAFPWTFHAQPWLLGCFTVGVASAIVTFLPNELRSRGTAYHQLIRYQWLAISIGSVAGIQATFRFFMRPPYILDTLVGVAVAFLLLYCSTWLQTREHGVELRQKPWLLSLFESRPSMALGSFSYSLYLTHSPILHAIKLLCIQYNTSPMVNFILMFGFGVVLSMAIALVFYRLIEKPALQLRTQY